MTQRQLASLLGVDPQTIRDITRVLDIKAEKRAGVAGNALQYDDKAIKRITRLLTPTKQKGEK